ncbi:MAG TPA: four helix bundle protein [Gemmatimonadales bacterium]|nr:four helix bundle protein [Gemmatimonadales bacterium]
MRDHTSLLAQEANTVVRLVFRATRYHWKPWAATLFYQLQRSSLSVQLNITEGYGRRLPGPFRNHLEIAYGSALETADLLRLLTEENIVPEELAGEAQAHCTRCQKLIRGLLKRLGDRR